MAATIGGPVAAPLQPPPGVNAGDHSEDMLHKLDDFKSLMGKERMGFLYARWRDHSCADPARRGQWQSQPMFGEGWQEKEDSDKGGLWQLKIINWGLMWDARGRMNNLHTSGEAMQTGVDQVFQRIHAAWTSKAGDAAAARITDFRTAAREYTAQLQTLGLHMEGAWRATRHAVEQLADFANKTDVGGKPMMDRYGAEGRSDDTGNEKRGQMSRWIDEIDTALRNGTYRWGIGGEAHEVIPDNTSVLPTRHMPQTAESVRRPGEVYLTEGDNAWANETCNWLDDFCHCYYLTVANFRRRVEQTLQEVENNWRNLEKMSNTIISDPFGKLSLTATQSTGDDGKKNPTDTGGDRPGTGSTGTSGTGTPLPPVQPPPMEPVDDTTSPSGTEPIVDPRPGLPEDQAKDQETVTIDDGDRKISVQSPDGEGHVKVTVDDGTGKPKTYDLDFSAGTGAGQPTQPGHALPDDARTETQPDGRSLPGQPEGRADTLPGQPETLPGQEPPAGAQPDPVQQVQAGPDGKAVVHDGNLTITAEHPPGAPDQIKITIDDGTGKPTTYVVDYSDPANPNAHQEPITAQPTQAGRPTAEPYPATDPLAPGPRTAQPMSFTDPATTGLPAPHQTAFTEPLSADTRGFTQPAGGFTDPATALQSAFADPATAEARGFAQPASGFTDPAGSDASGFAQSASGGFADSGTDAQSGFADTTAAGARGFVQPGSGFDDAVAGPQSGFAEPGNGGFADSAGAGGFPEAVNGGSPDTGTSTQGGFTEPVSGESRSFAQPADSGQQGGFAEPVPGDVRRFAGSAEGQQAGSLDPLGSEGLPASSTAPQSAGFTEPLDDQAETAFADHSFADSLSDDFAKAQEADDGFGALRSGFDDMTAAAEPLNGQSGLEDQDGFTTEPVGQPDLAAQAKADPAIGGFQPAVQPEVFDQAAAQAIDTDQAFDQGATAQASEFAAGPSIGDDLFRDWSTGLSDSDLGEYQSPESAPYERSEQLWTEPEPETSTSVQALGFDVDTGDDSGMDSVWSTQGDLFADTADTSEEIAPAAGEAGLATVPDNGQSQPQQSNATSAGGMGGGMPMMGMGGAGGGGGNTDQERGPSAWSTAGDLFDDGPLSAAERISTVLGDDER